MTADYRRVHDPVRPDWVAFALREAGGAGGLLPFDPARAGLRVAGMLGHALRSATESDGWSDDDISRSILSNDEHRGSEHILVGRGRSV